MAKKKKENALSYLQMPLPSGSSRSRMTRVGWGGLNRRQVLDSGTLSYEKNISTVMAPYLTPSPVRQKVIVGDKNYQRNDAISMFGFLDFLLVIYKDSEKIMADVIQNNKIANTVEINDSVDDLSPRSVVQFNAYQFDTETKEGSYTTRFLVFPDKVSLDVEYGGDGNITHVTVGELEPSDTEIVWYTNATEPYTPTMGSDTSKIQMNSYNNMSFKWDSTVGKWIGHIPYGYPDLRYVTVHMSRLFGVTGDEVFASGFNDYANWELDTAEEYGDANAWYSHTQANAKAGGEFVGITSFNNHVICFKRDFMHEVYNNKNPFRVQDIFAEGCIDNRSIQDVDGRLFFVSKDGVKQYTGSNPKLVGYDLGIDTFDVAVAGGDGRRYYLYCESGTEKHLFVYDTLVGYWSEESTEVAILSFAYNQCGVFALDANGFVYRMDTDNYTDKNVYSGQKWVAETEFVTNKSMDIKHIKKLQMYADIAEGSEMRGYLVYDNQPCGENFTAENAQLVYDSAGRTGRCAIRALPRNTASYGFRLRFEGTGFVKLYEMEVDLMGGGEMYVGTYE